jgi:hypothetical protein
VSGHLGIDGEKERVVNVVEGGCTKNLIRVSITCSNLVKIWVSKVVADYPQGSNGR